MAASYPAGVYAPRTKANRSGIVYEPERTTVGFAEDVTKLDDEVVAIETELGANPKGASASVAARLTAIEGSIPTVPVKATGAEINTGTDDAKFATPKAIADSNIAFLSDIPAVPRRVIQMKIVADDTALATGDGKLVICIPSELNGMNLVDADAAVSTVSSSGAPTVQVRNVTDSVDMLSTAITIDASEYTSYTAATQPVIDTSHDDVATGDLIAIDVDGAGTGAKGLIVLLSFAAA